MRCQLSPVASKLWKKQTTFFHVLLLLFFLFVLFFTSERRKKTKLCRPLSARHHTTLYYISLSSAGYFSSCFSSTCCCDVQHISFFIPSGGYFLYLLYRDTHMSSHIVFSIPSRFLFLFRFSLLDTFDLSVLYSPDGTPWRGGIFICTGVHNSKSTFRFGPAQVDFPSIDTHLHAGRDG